METEFEMKAMFYGGTRMGNTLAVAGSVRDNFKIDSGMRESQVTDVGPVSRVKADPTQCLF